MTDADAAAHADPGARQARRSSRGGIARTAAPPCNGAAGIPALQAGEDVNRPSGKVRLLVRTASAMGDQRRYRAGLGPFGREPVEVEVWPEQAAVIKSDPMLAVAEVGAE